MASTQFERDTLEGKDRDELTTIATAIGGKPTSRARKAELVDMIVDLAAGGSSNGTKAKAKPKPKKQEPVEQAEEPPAAWETEAAEEDDSSKKEDDKAADETKDNDEEEKKRRPGKPQPTQP